MYNYLAFYHMIISIALFKACSYSYSISIINLIQNTFGVKKARPSKVESYLEVNT